MSRVRGKEALNGGPTYPQEVLMSELLKQAQQVTAKVSALTNEQKKAIENFERQLDAIEMNRKHARALAESYLENKSWDKTKAKLEVAVADAQLDAQADEVKAKIRSINPAWTDGLTEQAQLAAATAGVKSLEYIGIAAGFIGKAIDTAKASSNKVRTGIFQLPKKENVLDILKS